MGKISIKLMQVILLAVTTVGVCGIFAVESQRKTFELHQLEAQRQVALQNEAYQAWRHATRYETFSSPLNNSNQEPKRDDTYRRREIWVKSFQRSDVRSDVAPKYGNAAYRVSTTVAFNDAISKGQFEVLLRSKATPVDISAALRGVWNSLTMQCKVEQLDGGEWIASDYKFSTLAGKPDFPFEKVKGDN